MNFFKKKKSFRTLKPARGISPKCFEKKSPSDELFLHFPSKVQNLAVFNYLHDSNSIFWAQGIKFRIIFRANSTQRNVSVSRKNVRSDKFRSLEKFNFGPNDENARRLVDKLLAAVAKVQHYRHNVVWYSQHWSCAVNQKRATGAKSENKGSIDKQVV